MLNKIQKPVSITELRQDISKYFKKAKDAPLLVSLDRGRDARVVIDVDKYNDLIETKESQDEIVWQESSGADALKTLGKISKDEALYYANL